MDPQRITQALVQLDANAVRFSEAGSVIAVGGRVSSEQAACWVRDEGVGVAAADQSKIFQRLGRGSLGPAGGVNRTRTWPGAGLGFRDRDRRSSPRRSAAGQRPGQGSTFTVVIPLRSPAAPIKNQVLEDAWPQY